MNRKPSGYQEDACREFHEAAFPALRYVARACGYALVAHGSLKFDLDYLAVPWESTAVSPEALVEKIRDAVKAIRGFIHENEGENPTIKPHGRQAWSFHLGGGPYIDLSVVLPNKNAPATPEAMKEHIEKQRTEPA